MSKFHDFLVEYAKFPCSHLTNVDLQCTFHRYIRSRSRIARDCVEIQARRARRYSSSKASSYSQEHPRGHSLSAEDKECRLVKGDDHPFLAYSPKSLSKPPLYLFEHSLVPFYPLSKAFLSNPAYSIRIWNMIPSWKKTIFLNLKMISMTVQERIRLAQVKELQPILR